MKKDFRYIIKRVIVAVIIYLVISFINSEVFAYTIGSYNGVDIDEEYIYNKILEYKPDFDINEYPYISVNYINTSSIKNLFIYAFNDLSNIYYQWPNNNTVSLFPRSSTSTSAFYINYNLVNSSFSRPFSSVPQLSSFSASMGYFDFNSRYNSNTLASNQSDSKSNLYTNYSLSIDISSDSSSYNSISSWSRAHFNTLDFSSFSSTTYMELSILDSSYNTIEQVNCIDNTEPYCIIQPLTSNTRYLKVLYHLDSLLGRRLDILNNSVQQVNTKIDNVVNPYISVNQVYLEYNYGDSTSNVANNLYFVSSSSSYNAMKQSYNFIYSFKENDTYSSISLYDFAVYYDLGAIPYSEEIKIPYYITFKTITSGGSSSTDTTNEEQQQQQIDQNQVIIDNLDDINNSINNSNVDGAKSDYSNFFDNFSVPDSGNLSSIITIPLQAISRIGTDVCRDIVLPVPNTDNKKLVLPCFTPIYEEKVPQLLNLWNLIILGIISYRVLVSLFQHIKDLHDPTQDKVEVIDL